MKIPVSEAVGVRVIKRKPRRRTPMLVFGLPLVAAAMMIGSLILSPGKHAGTGTLPHPQEVAYAGSLHIQTASHHQSTASTGATSSSGSASTASITGTSQNSPPSAGSTKPAAAASNNTTVAQPSSSASSSPSSGTVSGGMGGGGGTATGSTSSSTTTVTTPSLGVSVGDKPVLSASSLSLSLN